MCDFGPAPYGVVSIEDGQVKTFSSVLSANSTGYPLQLANGNLMPKVSEVKEEGIYHIAATGSYYSYYDGNQWWMDADDWIEHPNYERPEKYSKYKFLR